MRASHPVSFCVFIGFLLFWSAVVLFVDGLLVWKLFSEARTILFVAADGTVLNSSIEERGEGQKRNYRLKVDYRYTVNETEYTGNVVYPDAPALAKGLWDPLHARFPAGRAIEVYHSRWNPADAVLVTGIQGNTLLSAGFMTPFTIVMIGGWMGLFHRQFDPRRIRVGPDGWIIDLPGISYGAVFLLTLLLTSLVGTIATLVTLGPTPHAGIVALFGVLSLVLATTASTMWGRPQTLEVRDGLDQTLVFGGQVIPFAGCEKFEVREVRRYNKISSGKGNRSWVEHVVAVILTDGQRKTIAAYSNHSDAQHLADWLTEHTGRFKTSTADSSLMESYQES